MQRKIILLNKQCNIIMPAGSQNAFRLCCGGGDDHSVSFVHSVDCIAPDQMLKMSTTLSGYPQVQRKSSLLKPELHLGCVSYK